MIYEEMEIHELEEEVFKLEERNKMLDALRSYSGKDRVRHFDEVKRIVNAMPPTQSIKSKNKDLNKLLDGFEGGEIAIISGTTGSGKTTFAQSLAWDFADNGIKSLFFTYEVGIKDFVKRFPVDKLDMTLPMELKPYDLKWMEQRIWEGIAKFDIKAVFIDHLHYLVGMDTLTGAKSTSLAIGYILRELKIIAVKTGVTIFLLTHTTKTKDGETPSINDIRDSSFIGQEADIVLMVWRSRKKGEETISFVKVDKNRRLGNMGTIAVNFVKGRFYATSNIGQ